MIGHELHRETEGDLFGAAEYYEERVPGLGLDFLGEIEGAIASICQRPFANQLWPDIEPRLGIRRKLLHRFPYGLPYLCRDDRVILLAVVHLHREPGHWLGRARAYFK